MLDPFKILTLPEYATEEQIKERFRELAKTHHPDAGGEAEVFTNIQAAYKAALEISGKPKPCFYCDGSGKVMQKGGFFKLNVICPTCGGTGKR